jgi:hypothetical protein
VEITNTGSMHGIKTAQLYVSDTVASITGPIEVLNYFEKKEFAVGGKSIYRFKFTVCELWIIEII